MSVHTSVIASQCSNVIEFYSFLYIGLFCIVYVVFKLFDTNIKLASVCSPATSTDMHLAKLSELLHCTP